MFVYSLCNEFMSFWPMFVYSLCNEFTSVWSMFVYCLCNEFTCVWSMFVYNIKYNEQTIKLLQCKNSKPRSTQPGLPALAITLQLCAEYAGYQTTQYLAWITCPFHYIIVMFRVRWVPDYAVPCLNHVCVVYRVWFSLCAVYIRHTLQMDECNIDMSRHCAQSVFCKRSVNSYNYTCVFRYHKKQTKVNNRQQNRWSNASIQPIQITVYTLYRSIYIIRLPYTCRSLQMNVLLDEYVFVLQT